MPELLGTIRLGRLKRIYQVLYFCRHPGEAPFTLNGENEFHYISKGRGQYIPVRFTTDEWDLEKFLKLKFMEKVWEISSD